MNMNDTKTCVCVLGMHRSGTSCLTGIARGFGVQFGEVITSAPYNKKGNMEHPLIMQLNEELLAFNGGAWNVPVQVRKWDSEHIEKRACILELLDARDGQYWGFKDPRFLFTSSFWLEVLTPVFIATFRHPLRVAASLLHRNGMPIPEGVLLWKKYNERLLIFLDENNIPLVNFDLPANAYLLSVSQKLVSLGLPEHLCGAAATFFSNDLRNQKLDFVKGYELPTEVSSIYNELLSCSE